MRLKDRGERDRVGRPDKPLAAGDVPVAGAWVVVVVGGVNIFGGSGTVIGALLGTILIDLLEQSLIRWLEISEFWRDAILGLLILFAVAIDAVVLNRLRSHWARQLQQQQEIERNQMDEEAEHAA